MRRIPRAADNGKSAAIRAESATRTATHQRPSCRARRAGFRTAKRVPDPPLNVAFHGLFARSLQTILWSTLAHRDSLAASYVRREHALRELALIDRDRPGTVTDYSRLKQRSETRVSAAAWIFHRHRHLLHAEKRADLAVVRSHTPQSEGVGILIRSSSATRNRPHEPDRSGVRTHPSRGQSRRGGWT